MQKGPAPNERGNRALISHEGDQSRIGRKRTLYILNTQRRTTQVGAFIGTVLRQCPFRRFLLTPRFGQQLLILRWTFVGGTSDDEIRQTLLGSGERRSQQYRLLVFSYPVALELPSHPAPVRGLELLHSPQGLPRWTGCRSMTTSDPGFSVAWPRSSTTVVRAGTAASAGGVRGLHPRPARRCRAPRARSRAGRAYQPIPPVSLRRTGCPAPNRPLSISSACCECERRRQNPQDGPRARRDRRGFERNRGRQIGQCSPRFSGLDRKAPEPEQACPCPSECQPDPVRVAATMRCARPRLRSRIARARSRTWL